MRLFLPFAKILGLVLCGAILTSCNSNPLIVSITDCPGVGLVRYANSLTAFERGAVPVTTAVSHKATLSGLSVDCQDRGEGLRTRIDFTITAEAGPALRGSDVTIPYFVVIARNADELQGKSIYAVDISLDTRDGRARVRESVEFTIPTDVLADQYLYEVLIGFELSDAEARFNLES